MTTAAYVLQDSLDSSDVEGLFSRPEFTEEGISETGVINARATFVCRTIDLPDAAAEGDILVVTEGTFTITAKLSDGTGMTELRLKAQ